MIRLPILLAGLALVAACSDTSDVADLAPTGWSVDSVPITTVRDDDPTGEPMLASPVGATRLSDGSIIVADRGLHALRYFGANGEFQRAVGRKGLGPDEFGYMAEMLRCGDSLYVEDIEQQSVFVYSLDGVRTRAPKATEIHGQRSAYDSRCNANYVFVHNGWARHDDTRIGRVRWTVPYWISTTDGRTRTELGEHPGSERLVYEGGSEPHPLGRNPVLAIGRERVYIGTADSFAILAYSLDGVAIDTLRNADADLRTTAPDIERFKRFDTLGLTSLERDRQVRLWTTVEFPTTVPAYDAMLVDAEDHVWIRRFPRGRDMAASWLVFSPGGEQVAALSLPSALTVYEVGRDYVLGLELSPGDGEQLVRVYALHRPNVSAVLRLP
jgi:hypothetical protein